MSYFPPQCARFATALLLALLVGSCGESTTITPGDNNQRTDAGASDTNRDAKVADTSDTDRGDADRRDANASDADLSQDSGESDATPSCTASDLSNCQVPPNSKATGCSLGTCAFDCDEGYADLDSDLGDPNSNGCESDCTPTNEGVEICDGIDNNCDGQTDELNPGGGATCATDGLGVCGPGTERCVDGAIACVADQSPAASEDCGANGTGNGVDDDCNGQLDESCADCVEGDTQSCYTGPTGTADVGVCAEGTQTCSGGEWAACEGQITPGTEICDGIDNNCDGQIDENITRSCGTGTGYCRTGIETCTAGSWGSCSGARGPRAETCNGTDDDCDGLVDENITRSCGSDVGYCQAGSQSCSAGAWGSCSDRGPRAETCNGTDDDCDGQTDEGVKTRYYLDADDDGYGSSSSQLRCSPTGDYTTTQTGDCKDNDPNTHPGAAEVCGPLIGVDRDCDGNSSCADSDCNGRSCSAGGHNFGVCVAGACQTSNSCSDNFDCSPNEYCACSAPSGVCCPDGQLCLCEAPR